MYHDPNQYPYPLARRFTSYFRKNPEGIQNNIWTGRLVHDVVQYVVLILVADLYQNQHLVPLLPHYTLRDWIDLLERQMREELLRASSRDEISQIVLEIHNTWQGSSVEYLGARNSWYEMAKRNYFPPIDWDEGLYREIVRHLCDSLKPLLKFSLGWVQGEGRRVLCLKGADSRQWKEFAFSNREAKAGHLILYTDEICVDLFPFLVLAPPVSPTSLPLLLLWDGDVPKEKKSLYHAENHDLIIPYSELYHDEDIKMARSLPPSSYPGLLRLSSHQVKTFVARQSQAGRYPYLIFHPYHDIMAELNNFIGGKYSRLAILAGREGAGKTNFICQMAQQWCQEGHLVTIVEACDVREESLTNLAARYYVKSHTWEMVFREIPAQEGKRCILIFVGVEKHANIAFLLDQVHDFLEKYENPVYPIRILLIGDIEFLSHNLAKNAPLLSLIYEPEICPSRLSPFLIEIPPLSHWAVERIYLQYQKAIGNQGAGWPSLSPGLKRRMTSPLWLKLFTAGAGAWHLPSDIKNDELLYNYLDHEIWEHPKIWKALKPLLPLFVQELEILKSRWEEEGGTAAGELLEQGRRKGILQERTDLSNEVTISFSLPIVRDFLLARHLFEVRDMEPIRNLARINYNMAKWLLSFYFVEWRDTFVDETMREFLKYDVVAPSLILVQQIWPLTEKESKTLRICERLAGYGLPGANSLLSFLEALGENGDEEAFHLLYNLLWKTRESLPHSHLLKMLAIVARYYPKADDVKEWTGLLEGEPPIARQAAQCLSKIYYHGGDFENALKMAQIAANFSEHEVPQDTQQIHEDWQQIADCHWMLKKYKEAQEYYEKVLHLAQQLNDASLFIKTGYNMARLYERIEDEAGAINCYDEIIDLNQQLGNALNQIKALKAKALLLKASRAEEAVKIYRQAYEIAKTLFAYPLMAELLGEIAYLYHQHNKDQARQYGEYALKLARYSSAPKIIGKILWCLSDCYEKAGEREKALSSLKEAREIWHALNCAEELRTVQERLTCMERI